jgi:hypothetical protein
MVFSAVCNRFLDLSLERLGRVSVQCGKAVVVYEICGFHVIFMLVYNDEGIALVGFGGDGEVKEAITTCFASQAASFYDEGIQKLVHCYDKCLNNGGNYVEK